ncbi:hypothetical protein Fmac_028243 [Flemingia macrophylla]|uniref:GDSL esterase/lipase 1-like n=1 Tax=Flemingia macrophylla TaxID=520843 RepID=A0ABD1L6Y0_9FABA
MTTCTEEEQAALFIFGDSLFDNGNNNYINTTTSYQANYPPYGETFFKYPSGRFSDGRMIPDCVAELAKLPILPPYLHPGHVEYIYGVNFASGGAGALRETAQGMVTDLKTQLSYYKNIKKLFTQRLGQAKAEKILSKSVHLFSVGANDYGALIDPNSSSLLLPVNHQAFVDSVIGNISDVIKVSTNFEFIFGPCFEELSAIARLHNTALSKLLLELEKQLQGFKYSVTDFYSALSQVLTNPTIFGLKEASVGCCGGGPYRGDDSCGGNKGIKEYELCENPNEYLFFDSLHPTDRASQHFAELIWNGNLTVTSPYNLKQLFEI